MDEKGICASLTFGAPPFAHEEDALRAIEAGLAIHEELNRVSIGASIGIGTGRLFCGDYGGRSRREYGVLGPAINTAARLMEIAEGGILCDAATAEALRGQIFTLVQPRRVKGRSTPIQPYRPIGMLDRRRVHGATEMIGRDVERRILRSRLVEAQGGIGGLVLVQGEPGIGKSRLLSDLAEFAQQEGIPIARGFASTIDRSTPSFAWVAMNAHPDDDRIKPRIKPGFVAWRL